MIPCIVGHGYFPCPLGFFQVERPAAAAGEVYLIRPFAGRPLSSFGISRWQINRDGLRVAAPGSTGPYAGRGLPHWLSNMHRG